MTAVITAPSSPPGLDSSRSSLKSSSLRSSPPHDSIHDISHFEEISLTDSPSPSYFDTTSSLSSIPATPIKNRPPLKRTAYVTKSSTYYIKDKDHSPRNSLYKTTSVASTPHLQQSRSSPPARSQTYLESTTPLSEVRPRKRSSWQPNRRRSSKELEDEYDDLDEELPDDAIVWNIPLSPRPKDDATFSSGEQFRPDLPKLRTKSWDTALSGLTPEIKKLTNDLDANSAASPLTTSSPMPPVSSFMFPPPIQKGHNMVDPLPASKEKEKFLTRTRPSWLPPKCPKEEKRHLKQYQQMMSSFLDSEKRKSLRQSKSMANLVSETSSNLKVWQTEFLTNLDSSSIIDSPKLRRLLWQGVPSAIRATVWTRAIGNDLHISPTSYSAALARAKLFKSSNTIRNITADIVSTFPSVRCFQRSQRLYEPLFNVLLAYAAYRSDTDYIRGISGVAALLLHVLEGNEQDAFINLANILNRPLSLVYCLGDLAGIRRIEDSITKLLRHKMNHLADHFARLAKANASKNDVSEYSGWLDLIYTSLFTSLLDFDTCLRVWDMLVFERDSFVALAVVGIFRTVEDKLYACDIAAIDQLLGWQAWRSRADVRSSNDNLDFKRASLASGKDGLDVGGSENLIQAIRWASST